VKHVAHMKQIRNAHKILVRRHEEKRPLGRPRRRWEDNTKLDLLETGTEDVNRINVDQDRDQ
jgi:hypothetical protein